MFTGGRSYVRTPVFADDARGLHPVVEVDGGQSADTIAVVTGSGADAIVAGSSIFGTDDYATAIRRIREAAKSDVSPPLNTRG
jgi:ribulose-phosphate 3-epimerase